MTNDDTIDKTNDAMNKDKIIGDSFSKRVRESYNDIYVNNVPDYLRKIIGSDGIGSPSTTYTIAEQTLSAGAFQMPSHTNDPKLAFVDSDKEFKVNSSFANSDITDSLFYQMSLKEQKLVYGLRIQNAKDGTNSLPQLSDTNAKFIYSRNFRRCTGLY